jgi:ankyrin repeat protein
LKVTKLLYEANPMAVNEKGNFEELPLHTVLQCNTTLDVIKVLLYEAYPDVVKVKDIDGDLLLHFALRSESDPDIIKMIFDAYPEAEGTIL